MMNTLRTKCELSAADQEALAVELLYAEAANERTMQFEDHLAACDDCAFAFASIAHARLDVAEWNAVEFVPLSTPRIELPAAADMGGAAAAIRGFAQMFGWLGSSPAFAASILLVVLGAAALVVTNGLSRPETVLTSIVRADPGGSDLDRFVVGYPDVRTTAENVALTLPRNTAQKKGAAPGANVNLRRKRLPDSEHPDIDERNDIADGSLRLSVLFDELDAS